MRCAILPTTDALLFDSEIQEGSTFEKQSEA